MYEEEHKLQLYIYGRDALTNHILPSKKEGRFWLYHEVQQQKKTLIEIVARKKDWYFIQNAHCEILNEEPHYVKIETQKSYEIKSDGVINLLFIFPYQTAQHRFTSYKRNPSKKITIGRKEECDIVYNHETISSLHAMLYEENEEWWIQDMGSRNGVYVNGHRVEQKKLRSKDCIQIMAMFLLFAPDCIYVNELAQIQVKKSLQPFFPTSKIFHSIRETVHEDCILQPIRAFKKEIFQIDKYPPAFHYQNTPLVLLLGPAITMGLSSLSMGVFTLLQVFQNHSDITQSIPTLIMSFSMAAGTVLWPLLTRLYEKKQTEKKNLKRYQKYCAYLQEKENAIHQEIANYEKYLHKKYFTSKQVITFCLEHKIFTQAVDLKLGIYGTLGIADMPYDVAFDVPREEFVIQKDSLQSKLERVTQARYEVKQVPFAIKLDEFKSFFVKGKDAAAYMMDFLYQMVICYQKSIRIILCMDRKTVRKEKLNFLPFLLNDDESVRYLITHENDGKFFYPLLEEELRTHSTIFYMFFVFDHQVLKKLNLPALLSYEHTLCFHLQENININGWKKGVIDLHRRNEGIFYANDEQVCFRYELSTQREKCAVFLANQKQSYTTNGEFSSVCHFLDLYHCGNIEQLNIWERWQQGDVSKSLEVCIGMDFHKDLLMLDAHERYHGPHGLFAGMTGSGKSECLLTYILSLAVCFSPEDVSFLLIDYKGGTMAKTIAKLPHLAGVITNLEKDMMQRSLFAIKSELKKRQQLLSNACVTYDIGNMNIDKYHTLCLEHKELEKLSHLFIIADEFAELKEQQGEFMEYLKQSARIGRSLGVHLLLATQKPAGIIDDQIWSNAHFHICMKVQSTQDSQDMLKKVDAAYLKKAGECYFQVGLDEVYERGQIAWSQCAYKAKEDYEEKTFDEIRILQDNGVPFSSAHIRNEDSQTQMTQMEAIVTYIEQIAKRYHKKACSLWKEPLPTQLDMKANCNAVVMVDDMENQRQYLLDFDKTWFTHTVLYGSNAIDREELLMTLLYQMSRQSQAFDLHTYVFDFHQNELQNLKGHSGIVDVIREGEQEKVAYFFYQMREEIQKRKRKTKTSVIFIVFHNYEVFHELYEELDEEILYFLREGEALNIFCLFTLSHPHNLSFRFQQYVAKIITFAIHDTSDYSILFPKQSSLLPIEKRGNGMMLIQGRVVAFQTLSTHPNFIEELPRKKEDHYRIKMLPKHIAYSVMSCEQGVYLGKEIKSLQDVFCDITTHVHFISSAYRFLPAFLSLFVAQLIVYKKDVYSLSDTGMFYQNQEISADTVLARLKGTIPSVFIWKRPYLISNENIQQYLKERMSDDHHHHIFIFTMKEHMNFSQYAWFNDAFYDAFMLWIGKGIMEYSYLLKNSHLPQIQLKENQAIIIKEEETKVIQLWEEEING